jgi:hypothetical protein
MPLIRDSATQAITLSSEADFELVLPSFVEGDAMCLLMYSNQSPTPTSSPNFADADERVIWPTDNRTYPHKFDWLAVVWRMEPGNPGEDGVLNWAFSSLSGQVIALMISVQDVGNFKLDQTNPDGALEQMGGGFVGPTDPLSIYGLWVPNQIHLVGTPDLNDLDFETEWPPGRVDPDPIEAVRVDGVISDSAMESGPAWGVLAAYKNATGQPLSYDDSVYNPDIDKCYMFEFGHPDDPPVPPSGGFGGWFTGWLGFPPDEGGSS